MKRILPPLLLAISVFLSSCGKSDFDTLSGEEAHISNGKWQLVNYWATWCAPCREEIPALNRFSKRDDVTVYGVNYDSLQGSELRAAVAEMGIAFDSILHDPAEQLRQNRPQVLPSTFVISPAGDVIQVLTGPQTEASLESAISGAQ